jgi:hypothetical protein
MIAVVRLKLKNLRVTFAGPRPAMNGLVPVPRECRFLVSIATARYRFCPSQSPDRVRRQRDTSQTIAQRTSATDCQRRNPHSV